MLPVIRKRRKRSITKQEPKFGCPEGFKKLSEYMCVHMHQDANKKAIPNTFKDSKEYCKGIDSGANLLYFTSPNDAVKVWEWLGKLKLP